MVELWDDLLDDLLQEECAVMAVSLPSGGSQAVAMVRDGLHNQNHRGQDGSGIAYWCNGGIALHKALGLVWQVYTDSFRATPANVAMGHNRYATTGQPTRVNLQPHLLFLADGRPLAIGGNGDLVNNDELRAGFEAAGVKFASENDGETLGQILVRALNRGATIVEAIRELRQVALGAYSAVVLFEGRIYAFRDERGYRPLSMSRLPGGGIAIASETVAFDIILADRSTYQEILAGAILEIVDGEVIVHEAGHPNEKECDFEFIYFSRPDGEVCGLPVSFVRRRIGWQLALENPIELYPNSIVVPVPDSANYIGIGVAEGLGARREDALVRSHFVGRTFLRPLQQTRDSAVREKFNPCAFELEGAHVILVDDSRVRGTTLGKIVGMLRRAGVELIDLYVGSPQIPWPCFYGIATPTKAELIANTQTLEEYCASHGIRSVRHLSLEGLHRALGPITDQEKQLFWKQLEPYLNAPEGSYRARLMANFASKSPRRFCSACFTGQYAHDVSHLLNRPPRSSCG